MGLKHKLRTLLWKTGYDVTRFQAKDHPVARRKRFFEVYSIDTVLDVGANTGHYAAGLRADLGYGGKILSFEPLSKAFKALESRARRDPSWQTFDHALGDQDETREINIAANSESSSLQPMLPAHLKSAPQSEYIGKETIRVRTLDQVFLALCAQAPNLCLKIFVNGRSATLVRQPKAGGFRSVHRSVPREWEVARHAGHAHARIPSPDGGLVDSQAAFGVAGAVRPLGPMRPMRPVT